MNGLLKLTFIASLLLLTICASAQSPPKEPGAATDTGVKAYQSYGGARENISLTNGNLNLTIPLVELKGRNGLDASVVLVYESKNWKLDQVFSEATGKYDDFWVPETRWNNVTYGWHLNIPTIDSNASVNYDNGTCSGSSIVTLADGGKYYFNNRVGCGATQLNLCDADDTSGMRLDVTDPSAPVAIMRNGTRIFFNSISSQAAKVEDADGNFIQYVIDSGNSQVNRIVDALGRSITLTYSPTYPTAPDTITYKNSNGETKTITLTWSSVPLTGVMAIPTSGPLQPVHYRDLSHYGSWHMPSNISFPNGQSFSFTYNAYGDVSKITYPTGGYTAYDYVAPMHLNRYDGTDILYADFREISARRVCRNPSGTCTSAQEDVTTYTPNVINNANSSMNVVGPDGKLTRHEFTYSTAPGEYGVPSTPREIAVKSYDGPTTSSPLLQTVATTYDNSYAWALPTSITATLSDVSPNLVKKEEFDYDTYTVTYIPAPLHDYDTMPDVVTELRAIDNVTAHREYDWGSGSAGGLIRTTNNSWLKTNTIGSTSFDYSATGVHILSLKSSAKVYDGATLKAETDYEYDKASLASSSVSLNHETPVNGPARGNVTKFSRWLNTDTSHPRETNYTYFDTGNMYQKTDPGGHITTFNWDDNWHDSATGAGNTTCTPGGQSQAYLKSITNALSHVTTFWNNSCTGTLAQFSDPNSQKTQYSYDLMDRLASTALPDTGGSSNAYNDSTPFTVTSRTKQDTNSTHDVVNETEIDGVGRVVHTRLTSDPQGTIYTDTTYDALGRVSTVSNPYRSTSDSTYGVTTTQYDALGRVKQVTKPDGSYTADYYSGNWHTHYDEAGKGRIDKNDGLGRMVQVGEPNPAGTAWAYNTYYTYDVLNNLLLVDQPADGTGTPRLRTFTYNSLSQLTAATNPESGTISYAYDVDGNLEYKTDARGLTFHNFIDPLHRVYSRSYSNGQPSLYWIYDVAPAGTGPVSNGIGRLVYQTNNVNAAEVFSYDPMGRLYSQWDYLPSYYCNGGASAGLCNVIDARYDLAGNLNALYYPSGRKITHSYDSAARLTQTSFASFNGTTVNYPYYTATSFLPSGVAANVILGNGTTEIAALNNRLQPCQYQLKTGTTWLVDRSNLYTSTSTNCTTSSSSNNGNVASIVDNLNANKTQTFTYDYLNRITSGIEGPSGYTAGFGQTFDYDPWGNLLHQTGTKGNPPSFSAAVSALNRLAGYNYDAAGNLLNNGFQDLVYDAESQVASTVANGPVVTNYTYDASGQRVRKQTGSDYTEYVYFGGQPIAEKNQAGDWSDYIFAGGKRIARADTYEDRIHVAGTNTCSSCGASGWMRFANAGGYSGYTIQAGDKLFFRQQSINAKGGMALWFTDGSSTPWVAVDQNGVPSNSDSVSGVWNQRQIDLSQFAGKALSAVGVGADYQTQAGTWHLYFNDIALVSTDGIVRGIYAKDKAASLSVWMSVGVTNLAYSIEHDTPVGERPTTTTTYYHGDHLGSARMMTSTGGWPVSQSTFLPFGYEYNPQASTNHYKFTGKERDSESGLDYFGARYYSSNMGRWLSPDWSAAPVPVPYADLTDPQTLNLYGYVRNRPMSQVDPDGHAGFYTGADPSGLSNECRLMCDDKKNESGKKDGDPVNVVKGSGTVGKVVNDLVDGDSVARAAQNAVESETWQGKAGGYAALVLEVGINVIPGGGTEAKGVEKGGVWVYRIVENGKTVYVGITNDLLRRAAEHGVPQLQAIIKMGTRLEAKAVEQALISGHGLENLRNVINAISPRREFFQDAVGFGKRILEEHGYNWK